MFPLLVRIWEVISDEHGVDPTGTCCEDSKFGSIKVKLNALFKIFVWWKR